MEARSVIQDNQSNRRQIAGLEVGSIDNPNCNHPVNCQLTI
jgi:hypothetical protein